MAHLPVTRHSVGVQHELRVKNSGGCLDTRGLRDILRDYRFPIVQALPVEQPSICDEHQGAGLALLHSHLATESLLQRQCYHTFSD